MSGQQLNRADIVRQVPGLVVAGSVAGLGLGVVPMLLMKRKRA